MWRQNWKEKIYDRYKIVHGSFLLDAQDLKNGKLEGKTIRYCPVIPAGAGGQSSIMSRAKQKGNEKI